MKMKTTPFYFLKKTTDPCSTQLLVTCIFFFPRGLFRMSGRHTRCGDPPALGIAVCLPLSQVPASVLDVPSHPHPVPRAPAPAPCPPAVTAPPDQPRAETCFYCQTLHVPVFGARRGFARLGSHSHTPRPLTTLCHYFQQSLQTELPHGSAQCGRQTPARGDRGHTVGVGTPGLFSAFAIPRSRSHHTQCCVLPCSFNTLSRLCPGH